MLADLAGELAQGGPDPVAALARYEALRLAPTARIVQTNRSMPPDFINTRVDALSGGKPLAGSVDDLISQDELRRISDDYKKVAGFSLEAPGPLQARPQFR